MQTTSLLKSWKVVLTLDSSFMYHYQLLFCLRNSSSRSRAMLSIQRHWALLLWIPSSRHQLAFELAVQHTVSTRVVVWKWLHSRWCVWCVPVDLHNVSCDNCMPLFSNPTLREKQLRSTTAYPPSCMVIYSLWLPYFVAASLLAGQTSRVNMAYALNLLRTAYRWSCHNPLPNLTRALSEKGSVTDSTVKARLIHHFRFDIVIKNASKSHSHYLTARAKWTRATRPTECTSLS